MADIFDPINLALMKKLGGGSGGGSGGFATGTIFFENQTELNNNGDLCVVNHNLGYAPEHILWFVEKSESINSAGYLTGNRPGVFEYIAKDSYAFSYAMASSAERDFVYDLTDSALVSIEKMMAGLGITETTFNFLGYGRNMGGQYIPANTTIRWIVW